MTDYFRTAVAITRNHAAAIIDASNGVTPFKYVGTFKPNECAKYHSAISFHGERCPACKALAERERLEDKLDQLNDRLSTALDERDDKTQRLNEISRRRI